MKTLPDGNLTAETPAQREWVIDAFRRCPDPKRWAEYVASGRLPPWPDGAAASPPPAEAPTPAPPPSGWDVVPRGDGLALLRAGVEVGIITRHRERGYAVLMLGVGAANWDYPINDVIDYMKHYIGEA